MFWPKKLMLRPEAGVSNLGVPQIRAPMQAGPFEKATTMAETMKDFARYAVAEFRTRRPVQLLDLTKRRWVSIFWRSAGKLEEWCRFMNDFITDFERPVSRNGEQHYEYVPT